MKKIVVFFIRCALYSISLLVRTVTNVDKKKIVCWSNAYKIYGCNPKYITEYLLNHDNEYEIYWVLRKSAKTNEMSNRIHIVRPYTLQYIYVINTAGFIFNNFRTEFFPALWKKRKSQKYIMTWHGSIPLKKIEKDVDNISMEHYFKVLKEDSQKCDLMLSNSSFNTTLIRRAMAYSGEILEAGVPRNDLFFDINLVLSIEQKIKGLLQLENDVKIVLYAPTFRTNHDISCYDINWLDLIPALQNFYSNKKVVVLYRLHPDLTTIVKSEQSDEVIDVSSYPDMQELMCCSDMLITDYSSTMFEFSLLNRPCFLYASDYKTYDRDFYFEIDKLPFPFSYDIQGLKENLQNFDNEKYIKELNDFYRRIVGLYDKGEASATLYKWMKNN